MKRRVTIFLLPAVLLPACWWVALACGPDFTIAVFSYHRHPDLPRSTFIGGRLGVLPPTYARSYLVIAYRHLNGIGMNPQEREQALDYYKDRDTAEWDRSGSDWPERWEQARSRIQTPRAPKRLLITGGQMAYDPETHSFALNCAEDAFRVALHTLEARRAMFGVSSAAFRSWLTAQDQVFANCDAKKPVIPAAAEASLPAAIRADRAYQIAAAHFYAGQYETAVSGFRQIAGDPASPWANFSRYLVVRTLLRMTEDAAAGKAAGAQLNQEANAILSDAKLTAIHGMTWNLVERAGIRERNPEYFRALGRLLSTRGQDNGFREELWNYTDLYDGMIGQADPNAIFRPQKPVAADPSLFQDVDLSDWIFSFQSRDAPALAHCLERWNRTRSAAWMLAAIAHAPGTTARDEGLLDAAGAIPESSPAYLTARYHLFRSYEELGQTEAAREGLDALLGSAQVTGLPSSANLLRGLRMAAAPSLAEFVTFAVRTPVLVTWDLNIGEAPLTKWGVGPIPDSRERLDRDATRVLNRETPFRVLAEAATGTKLPAHLQQEALLTAFTRGLMVGEDLAPIAARMAEAEPELAAEARAYTDAKTDEERRFAAAFLILRRPEARPYFGSGISRQSKPGKLDRYRDNWWCPMDIPVELDSRARFDWASQFFADREQGTQRPVPTFLAGEAAADAKREFEALGKLHAAGDFLASIVFPYAESHGEDARVPEALYHLVRVVQYGCVDVDTWRVARDAFEMLHRRYGKTEWAKRTPVWVKNDLDIRRMMRDR